MKTIEILYNLNQYQNLLNELYEKESKENPGVHWAKSIENHYGFITLKVEYGENTEYRLHCAILIKFDIKESLQMPVEIYTENPLKRESVEKSLRQNKAMQEAKWHEQPNNTWYHDEPTTAYINIADEIAKEGYNCSGGDHYSPGYFSEIKVSQDGIFLNQINLYNAKSIDHKNNYHMRKLRFFIPLYEHSRASREIDDMIYEIGSMQITFSDHSSPVNKACGQKIVEQILQQKAIFEN